MAKISPIREVNQRRGKPSDFVYIWLNALNALSEDNSLLVMRPWINPYLLAAMAVSFAFHFMILHVDWMAKLFSIVPLDYEEWKLVFLWATPVILIDEVLKAWGRKMNAEELAERLKQD